MRKADKCVHYNGTVNECCEAGVNYKALAAQPNGTAPFAVLPCLGRYASEGTVTCDKRRVPTPEEVEADERAMRERMDRMTKVRAAIVEHLGGPWKKGKPSAGGAITCPCCGGTVRFSRAGYNGHIHAACSTEGCASWME